MVKNQFIIIELVTNKKQFQKFSKKNHIQQDIVLYIIFLNLSLLIKNFLRKFK